MIISASYRTDIPAFYGEWFLNRLDAGYCMVANPYGSKPYRVSLRREHVDGFVFWTKNLHPFLDKLDILQQRGYPFVVQYSINGYPRTLEFSVVDALRSVRHMREIAARFGRRVAVWRYDPIVFSSVTPRQFHVENFARLASELEGTTDEVAISFAQVYKKTLRNMNWAAGKFGFSWEDPVDQTKIGLVSELVEIARSHGMQLSVCSQRAYVTSGAEEARCIDTKRLSDVAGHDIRAALKGNRPECGCHLSRDIGAYDTCPHGCVYCYAVLNRGLAQSNYKAHDPRGEFLFKPASVEEFEPRSPEVPVQPRLL
jgi:hypothetical protein